MLLSRANLTGVDFAQNVNVIFSDESRHELLGFPGQNHDSCTCLKGFRDLSRISVMPQGFALIRRDAIGEN